MKAVVVGAGVAGLTAARSLHRAGWEVVVLEADDGIGGRVRTDEVEGFRLDRGFQTLFTAYPAVQAELDLKALRLRRFDHGVILAADRRWNEVGDPFKDVKALAPSAASPIASLADKRLLLRLRRHAKHQQLAALLRGPEPTTEQFLRDYGFSERFIELFFRGVFGAMFLDRSLCVSSRRFLFNMKMLAEGRVAVPRDGMQAIPDQLARDLPDVRLGTPALRLLKAHERVAGVQTSNEDFEGDVVLLAAHSPEVERLSGLPMPKEAQSVTCLYFHLPYPIYGNKKVVINGYSDAFVTCAMQITNVAPSYAPQPEHLLAAVILGAPDLSMEQLSERALTDMQRWFPWRGIGGLRPMAAYQVPFAQLSQPPGFRRRRPGNRTAVPGLYLAGEYTEASSLNGAMASGRKAAKAVLSDISQ